MRFIFFGALSILICKGIKLRKFQGHKFGRILPKSKECLRINAFLKEFYWTLSITLLIIGHVLSNQL